MRQRQNGKEPGPQMQLPWDFLLTSEPKLTQDISMQSVQSPHSGSHVDPDTSPLYT